MYFMTYLASRQFGKLVYTGHLFKEEHPIETMARWMKNKEKGEEIVLTSWRRLDADDMKAFEKSGIEADSEITLVKRQ